MYYEHTEESFCLLLSKSFVNGPRHAGAPDQNSDGLKGTGQKDHCWDLTQEDW